MKGFSFICCLLKYKKNNKNTNKKKEKLRDSWALDEVEIEEVEAKEGEKEGECIFLEFQDENNFPLLLRHENFIHI